MLSENQRSLPPLPSLQLFILRSPNLGHLALDACMQFFFSFFRALLFYSCCVFVVLSPLLLYLSSIAVELSGVLSSLVLLCRVSRDDCSVVTSASGRALGASLPELVCLFQHSYVLDCGVRAEPPK